MKWFVREASLVTAIAALVLIVEPAWFAPASRLWLVAIALLASGAIWSGAFGRFPSETALSIGSTHQLGEIYHLRDIEQANDFLLAADYQLIPFLQRAVREIAMHRLFIHHDIVLDREPDRARHLLGEEAWEMIEPVVSAGDKPPWTAISFAKLAAVADALESL